MTGEFSSSLPAPRSLTAFDSQGETLMSITRLRKHRRKHRPATTGAEGFTDACEIPCIHFV